MTTRSLATLILPLVFVTVAHAALRTWDGGGGDNFWMTPANWVTDTAPLAGDDLFFPSGAARLSNSNNFAAATSFNSVMFSTGGYELRGSLVTLKAGLTNLAGAGSNIIRAPLSLSSNQAFSCNSGNFLLGDIDTGRNSKHRVGSRGREPGHCRLRHINREQLLFGFNGGFHGDLDHRPQQCPGSDDWRDRCCTRSSFAFGRWH
jgi:hypothetical protein